MKRSTTNWIKRLHHETEEATTPGKAPARDRRTQFHSNATLQKKDRNEATARTADVVAQDW